MKMTMKVIMMVLAIFFTSELKDFLFQNTYLIVNECNNEISVHFFFPPNTTLGIDMDVQTQYNECIVIRQNQNSTLELNKPKFQNTIEEAIQKMEKRTRP